MRMFWECFPTLKIGNTMKQKNIELKKNEELLVTHKGSIRNIRIFVDAFGDLCILMAEINLNKK